MTWGLAGCAPREQRAVDLPVAGPGQAVAGWCLGQVPGQVAGGLGDQHDHGEVAEELKRAGHALARLRAVRAGWLPQEVAQPGPALAARGCAGAGLGGRVRRWPYRAASAPAPLKPWCCS